MRQSKVSPSGSNRLRRRAEGHLDSKHGATNQPGTNRKTPRPPDETERLVHELEVHQIELEMQNEELRHATETLEAAKSEYADLYDFAPIGYFTLDATGAIQRLNLTGARLLSVERTTALRRRLETFVSDADRDVLRTFLREVFACPERRSCEIAIESKSESTVKSKIKSKRPAGAAPEAGGRLIRVRITATLAENKRECRAVAMDVTDETEALRALRVSELRYRTLVEAMEDSVITTDRRGCVTSVQSRRLENLGIPTATFIGKTAGEVYGAEVGAKHEATHNRVLAGEPVVYEWKHEVGGERFQMQTIASPLRDADGHITGSLDVSRDVTELKRLHEQVLLSERMSSLGILAAGIAHEINNPLAVVIGSLELTLEKLRHAERNEATVPQRLAETVETLGDCLESADRVREIVRDLKVFSRADEASRSAVDLRRVVKASLKLVKNEIRHRATLVTEYEEVPAVLGNEARLGQVALNLLVNAAQSLPEGNAAANTITIRTRTHLSGGAVLEVSDTGPGIPDAIMGHIFEPFFTTKPIGVGTGLGLTICRQIVTELGGEITVTSDPDKGTRFRVFLPAAASKPVEAAGGPGLASPTGRRGRILLIDDDPDVLKILARTLSTRHDVVPCARAQEALNRIVAGEPFDLVISDVMMPEMTGMDLYEALRGAAPHHAQRMIFLTGGAFTPRARTFLAQVSNLCFDKPFDRQSLLAQVDRFVR